MKRARIWEIDLARVIAIFLMVTFHTVYDLREFVGLNLNYESGFWYFIGKASALIFIFVSGISSMLSSNSSKRAIKVIAMAMIVTAATFVAIREEYIRFGILHLIGFSMILSPYIKNIKSIITVILAAIFIALGFWIKDITVNTFLLIPFGVMYNGFSTVDYYPIFPYMGVYMLGIVFGKNFYREGKSLFHKDFDFPIIRAISSQSLKIYLLHQPVILGIILGINYVFRK